MKVNVNQNGLVPKNSLFLHKRKMVQSRKSDLEQLEGTISLGTDFKLYRLTFFFNCFFCLLWNDLFFLNEHVILDMVYTWIRQFVNKCHFNTFHWLLIYEERIFCLNLLNVSFPWCSIRGLFVMNFGCLCVAHTEVFCERAGFVIGFVDAADTQSTTTLIIPFNLGRQKGPFTDYNISFKRTRESTAHTRC